MTELNHWHPVLQSQALKQHPVAIQLCGQDLVLFRTPTGAVGALRDSCPHRRMRLSRGWVEGNRLVCPFHGWSYAPNGQGHSPSTPGLKPCAHHLETAEQYGFIWVKAAGSEAQLPRLEFPDYEFAGVLEHRIEAPLELVVDVFAEMEHAPTSHTFFGYAPADTTAVEPRFDFSQADCIHLLSILPQRPLPWILEKLFGMYGGDRFCNHLTMRFSPVYHTYDMHWENARTGQPRQERLLSVFFFVPINSHQTQCISLHYMAAPRWGRWLFHGVQKHILQWVLDHEVKRDKHMLEQITDQRVDLTGMCLGRFDPILVEYRQRLRDIYRGQPAALGGQKNKVGALKKVSA